MIKKHQKFSIYATYQTTSSKQLLKKTFEPTKENLNIEVNLRVLMIQLLLQPDGETYCCCKNLLANKTEITGAHVHLCRIFSQFIATTQDGFIAPHVLDIVDRKNLTIFRGSHYSRFYIMFSSSFRKIETKNLISDPRILIFLVLGGNFITSWILVI